MNTPEAVTAVALVVLTAWTVYWVIYGELTARRDRRTYLTAVAEDATNEKAWNQAIALANSAAERDQRAVEQLRADLAAWDGMAGGGR